MCCILCVPATPGNAQSAPSAVQPGRPPSSGQLQGDARIVHALDRFTFGSRPGDLEAIRAMGLEKWFDSQLHPAAIDETGLNARLAQFPAMQWRTTDLLYRFPSNPVIRQAMNGKASIPEYGTLHAVYENQICRLQVKRAEQSQKPANGPQNPAAAPAMADPPSAMAMDAGSAANTSSVAQTAPSAIDVTASMNALDRPVAQQPQPDALLALPPRQRAARLQSMQPGDFDSFIKSLRPAQRVAVDGLNVVVPYREKNYYDLRPSIAIPQNQVLDLDGFFGLHPSLAAFKPLYDQGQLAVVHAVGSPDKTRSHFDAQDYMESGTPGVKNTADGWLNRALQAEDLRHRCQHTSDHSAFRALALGAEVPLTLAGRVPAIALNNVNGFTVAGRGPSPSPAASAYEAMYAGSGDRIFHAAGDETFEAVSMLRAANPAQYSPAPGVEYPNSEFGNSMKQIAQLLKADLGVEAAFADVSGWDTHQNQGAVEGQLSARLRDFSLSISAFWRDLGDSAENVTLVTLSEFGRTARENGTGGTDHGHANAMFVLGGQVKGGKVYGRWPGLANEQLNEGRDLALTTDFRQVLGEVVARTLGAGNLEQVFPGAALAPNRFLRLV
jgi:uncharacterized protein (DUF1501 family)